MCVELFHIFLSIFVIFCLILFNNGQIWPIMVNHGQLYVILVNFSCFFEKFLVYFWWIVSQLYFNSLVIFDSFSHFFLKDVCQIKYLLNYCWKSIVKSIIFSIILWSDLVEPGFESSLDPTLDSEDEGLSRVWTRACN